MTRTLHQTGIEPGSVNATSFGSFTTLLSPFQIMTFAPWQDRQDRQAKEMDREEGTEMQDWGGG